MKTIFIFILSFLFFNVELHAQDITTDTTIICSKDSCVTTIQKFYYQRNMLSDSIEIPFGYDTVFFNQLKKDIQGVDCSRWQGIINWNLLNKDKYGFVFIKATQSHDYIDPQFDYNWNNCKLPKGAYHFFNPSVNGTLQAKHFLKVAKLKKGDLLPVIDVEYTYRWRKANRAIATKNLKLMLDYIESELGVKPIIYTNCSFWVKYVQPFIKRDMSQYPLWVAHYYTDKPRIPNIWDKWIIWQYTPKGRLSASHTDWDLNYLNGTDLSEITIK